MTCGDLKNIRQLSEGMALVAGGSGLDRTIRWIYFADCVQCLSEDFDLQELIYGGELVIVTNESITGNEKKILDMIRVMNEKHVAAFVINEGQISEKIAALCEDLALPLYELSVSLHLIDVSQILCKALVEEEMNANSAERILTTILFAESFRTEDIIEQARGLDLDLSGAHRAVLFRMGRLGAGSREDIAAYVRREFTFYGLKSLMTLSQNEAAVALVPAERFDKALLSAILENIVRKFEANRGLALCVGVGGVYKYIDDVRKSYSEAKNTLKIMRMAAGKRKVHFYEDAGVFSFILEIKNDKFLDDYVKNKLGIIMEADRMQEGQLLKTLEAYLENNCNANLTAEALYIHRNTMRYRLDKIRKLLNNELADLSVFLELKLAFAVRRYREGARLP